MRTMEIRVLRYFLMVAREENITKAAELLHITQPTLSRQLMQLEEELSGSIVIGSGEANSVQELAEIIGRFQKKYPQVEYDLYTANADDIKERLDKGLLDIGLLTEPVDIGKYNFLRLKGKEKWGILVRRDSGLAQTSAVRPQDLMDVPVFLAQRPLVRNELEGWFGEYYDQIHVAGTYNLINNVAVMVENNIGVAFCFQLQNHFDNLKYIPLSPQVETGAVIVWKKAQTMNRTMRQFINFIREYQET